METVIHICAYWTIFWCGLAFVTPLLVGKINVLSLPGILVSGRVLGWW